MELKRVDFDIAMTESNVTENAVTQNAVTQNAVSYNIAAMRYFNDTAVADYTLVNNKVAVTHSLILS